MFPHSWCSPQNETSWYLLRFTRSFFNASLRLTHYFSKLQRMQIEFLKGPNLKRLLSVQMLLNLLCSSSTFVFCLKVQQLQLLVSQFFLVADDRTSLSSQESTQSFGLLPMPIYPLRVELFSGSAQTKSCCMYDLPPTTGSVSKCRSTGPHSPCFFLIGWFRALQVTQ